MVTWLKNFISKIRVGFSKSYADLWAMAQEARLFMGSLTREYEQVPTVYKAIKAISDNVCQAQLKFYRRDTDEEVTNPDLERLFRNPNPLMSLSELIEGTVVFHRLCGEGFWVFTESIGQAAGTSKMPAEIWTFHPSKFKEQKDSTTGQLLGWKYGTQFFPVEQVMHFRDFNPYDEIRGLSPLKPARETIDIDWQQMIYNKAFFKNDATPNFALSTDQPLNKTQRAQMMEWWNKEHKGASNAFKAAVFESGVKPVSIAHSANDMQFIEQKKWNREEILGIWRVPKSMFSITDDLNYATFVGQKKVFWTDTIMPILTRLAEELNSQFFARFMPDVYCKFDYSNVMALQDDIKDKADIASKFFAMGVPFNQINERFNLGFDDIEGGDTGYLPFGLTPISAVNAPPPDNTPKSITQAQTEVVWKSFLKLHEGIERKFFEAVRTHLYQQRSRVLIALNEKSALKIQKVENGVAKLVSFTYDWDKEAKVFAQKVSPNILQAILAGAEYAKNVAGGNIAEAILDGKLRSYLAVQVNELKRITEYQKEKVEGIISNGIQQGSSSATIADDLRSFYNGFTPMAAMRISRTETTRGINGGTVQYFEAVGAKTKTWITANDENVRDSHIALHGKTININERFANGLMFPGDEGKASEVVNCRCTLVTRERFE